MATATLTTHLECYNTMCLRTAAFSSIYASARVMTWRGRTPQATAWYTEILEEELPTWVWRAQSMEHWEGTLEETASQAQQKLWLSRTCSCVCVRLQICHCAQDSEHHWPWLWARVHFARLAHGSSCGGKVVIDGTSLRIMLNLRGIEHAKESGSQSRLRNQQHLAMPQDSCSDLA